MNYPVEELHQARLKQIADTEAVMAELEALVQSCDEEIEAPAQANLHDTAYDAVQPMTLDELRRYGIPPMGVARVTSVIAEPVPESQPEGEGSTEGGQQTGAGEKGSAETPDALSTLDALLTESRIDMAAPIEQQIDIVIASTDEAVVADDWPQPPLGMCVSLEDEISGLEAELLAVMVSETDAAQVSAAQSSAIGVASILQPSWGMLAGQAHRDRCRSLQNRATYEKKKPGARKYAKPSDMTDEERAAHETAQRKARKARELEQRKLKRVADKVAKSSNTTD